MDPAKLKVVELRAELSQRGLETKGNKPALVKRLKEALEEELREELPDTSIADTSTEDLDTSQPLEEQEPERIPEVEPVVPAVDLVSEPEVAPPVEISPEPNTKVEETGLDVETVPDSDIPPVEQSTVEEEPPKVVLDDQEVAESVTPAVTEGEAKADPAVENAETNEESSEAPTESVDEPMEEAKSNGASADQDEPKAKRSRWGSEVDSIESKQNETEGENNQSDAKDGESETKGEKRKRSSSSPDRSQRRRSKSPIKEDEPSIDNDKVQLNWYDSDLHLQLDKESLLSAKPYHEGAFGFAWAGVRATHGVNTGKVCFEVKITDELKWDDYTYYEKLYKQQHKSTSRHKSDTKKKRDHSRDRRDSVRSENGDKNSDKASNDGKSSEKTANDEKSSEKAENDEEEATSEKGESDEKTIESAGNPESADDKPESMETDEAKQEPEPESAECTEVPLAEEKMETDSEKSEEQEGNDKQSEEKSTEEKSTEEKSTEEKSTEEKSSEEKSNEEKLNEEKSTEEKSGEENQTETAIEKEDVKEVDAGLSQIHQIRIGWSLQDASLQLGEHEFSYGYESSGRFLTSNTFTDYGIKFGLGDVVSSYLAIDEENLTITFAVNGVLQPEAVNVPTSDLPDGFALFPHVASRNCSFELNLGGREEAWFAHPEGFEQFAYLDAVEEKIAGPIRPENRSDCEVILMCGLPFSGKTQWAREHVAANAEKRYTVLGNAALLERMKVSGQDLKNKYTGCWYTMVEKLQKCVNRLVEVAALRRRNYIIDQTNVFPAAQRRKLRPFEGFKRRAVVVVLGDEEQAKRQSLQEAQGIKDVPDSAVLDMKANMNLPHTGEWMDEVIFAELPEEEAKAQVLKYNSQGKEAGYGIQRRYGHRDDRNKWQHNRRNDYRGSNYRDRNYHNNRYDRGPPRHGGGGGGGGGNWHHQQRSSGGSWGGHRDRRDNRGPPPPPMGRDWRNRGRDSRGGHRDGHSSHGGSGGGGGSNYNRNRSQGGSGGRSSGGGWQSGGGSYGGHYNQPWQSGGGSGGQSGGAWQQQSPWSQGGGGGSQWKYGGGGGAGSGGSSGQSYGQQQGAYPNYYYYQQQGQTQSAAASANQYGQYSQQDWAQYAQQYAQQGQNSSLASTPTQSTQK